MTPKAIVTLILTLITLTSFGQRDSVKFSNDIFSGIYSEVYQQPLVISYDVILPIW